MEYDFYGYGQRKAKDNYEDINRTRENILKKFGKDALLQFDCGFMITTTRYNLASMEESLPKINDIINGKIETSENERNNSYFDRKGTSNRYDEHGNYIDPMKR